MTANKDFIDVEDIAVEKKGKAPNLQYDTSKEDILDYGQRQIARSATRFAEGALGTYGDAYNMRSNLEDFLIETGASFLPESVQKPVGEFGKAVVKGPVRYAQESLVEEPYGSTELFKKASDQVFEGYTNPQTDLESHADDIFTMTGSLLLGGPEAAGQGIAKKFLTDLGLSTINKLSKEGVKLYGGSPIAQEAAGLGSMFIAAFLGKANPKEIASKLYNIRNSRITPTTIAPAQNLEASLKNSISQMQIGGDTTPAQKQLIKEAQIILSKIKKGKIPVQELTEWQKKLNKLRQSYPDITWDNREIDTLRKANQEAIASGLKNDPIALKAHRDANEAFGVGAETTKLQNWVNRYIPEKLKDSAIGHALGMAPIAAVQMGLVPAAGVAAKASTLAGAALLASKTTKVIRHIMKSPVLRREYAKLMNSIIEQKAPAAIRQATMLNDKLEKDKKFQESLKDSDFIDADSIE